MSGSTVKVAGRGVVRGATRWSFSFPLPSIKLGMTLKLLTGYDS